MNSSVLQKSLSRVLQNSYAIAAAKILLMFLFGVIAITLHAKLRIPMHLPGKQGFLFMFILISGWYVTRFRFSALIFCSGSALFLFTPILGFADPFLASIYFFMGIVMEGMLTFNVSWLEKPWFLGFVTGIGYMVIPVARLILSAFTGIFYSSFLNGMGYPIFTHFIFGFLGGYFGFIAIRGITKKF